MMDLIQKLAGMLKSGMQSTGGAGAAPGQSIQGAADAPLRLGADYAAQNASLAPSAAAGPSWTERLLGGLQGAQQGMNSQQKQQQSGMTPQWAPMPAAPPPGMIIPQQIPQIPGGQQVPQQKFTKRY